MVQTQSLGKMKIVSIASSSNFSFNFQSIELLCERVSSSAGEQLNPGEAFRHVLEAIASGLLLPGGAGLLDPCEKEPTDALNYLSRQEREDITASAQVSFPPYPCHDFS